MSKTKKRYKTLAVTGVAAMSVSNVATLDVIKAQEVSNEDNYEEVVEASFDSTTLNQTLQTANTLLEEKVELASKTLNSANTYQDAYTKLSETVEKAQSLINTKTTTQEEINGVNDELVSAISTLSKAKDELVDLANNEEVKTVYIPYKVVYKDENGKVVFSSHKMHEVKGSEEAEINEVAKDISGYALAENQAATITTTIRD